MKRETVSDPSLPPPSPDGNAPAASRAVFPILLAVSVCHLLNDTIQSLIAALYPMIKESFSLNFTHIGLITLTSQLTASLLQPLVGLYTDRRPMPFSLAIGVGFTAVGLVVLALAGSFGLLLFGVGLVGIGSAVFHPEASRMAHLAAGQRHGFAQSFFQLGGNFGSSLGPLLAVFILTQRGILWLCLLSVAAFVILIGVGRWRQRRLSGTPHTRGQAAPPPRLPRRQIGIALAVLLTLIFSKYFYIAGFVSYFTFYLIEKFHVSVQSAQLHLFAFLAAVAAGTLAGGPIGDRFGRKFVIWGSILGAAPFTLALPYANLFWTQVLIFPIGLILASAFSAILVYAQELMPGRVGMIAGLFFGFAFGMGGIGSAVLGKLADATSIEFVFRICAFLPLLGLLTAFLPSLRRNPSLRDGGETGIKAR